MQQFDFFVTIFTKKVLNFMSIRYSAVLVWVIRLFENLQIGGHWPECITQLFVILHSLQ